jgi:enoyl-CoA hydratase/carnithine racemase
MVHPREALRMALMGNDERISAQTALRIGLVTEITTREALWPRAHEIAALIAAKPSVATQGAVRAIWESLDQGRQAALDHGIIYNRIANPIGEAQVDRWNLPKAKWSLR